MFVNEKTEVVGENVLLVPYDEHLVPKYHEWMKSSELLETTASEPLTLEQELEMQKSWRRDEDKLTFIALEKSRLAAGEVAAMIGDTNLFIGEPGVAEVMVMIAETACRRKGFGREALLLILRYGIETLNITKYEAKISRNNTPSINLFQSLKFEKTSESAVFDEITMTKQVTTDFRELLTSALPSYETKTRE